MLDEELKCKRVSCLILSVGGSIQNQTKLPGFKRRILIQFHDLETPAGAKPSLPRSKYLIRTTISKVQCSDGSYDLICSLDRLWNSSFG
ncbi:hypothetical protein L2E82_00459 [Cichorium intybus]|uniref:Uncharacterized protein n=1 Tax=Cichorium intybus TaxID=13427 RepID=A0ACB9GX53_CICIN|nr:hypothetical protein L2E82_00459 [Cichorium intybus]